MLPAVGPTLLAVPLTVWLLALVALPVGVFFLYSFWQVRNFQIVHSFWLGNYRAAFGGTPGWLRLFDQQVGGQIAWLLPLAAVGLVAGLWLSRRAPRTDRRLTLLALFGVWGLVDFVVFSRQQGIFLQLAFHPAQTLAHQHNDPR